MRRLTALLVLGAVFLGIAGCGGGGDDPEAEASTSTSASSQPSASDEPTERSSTAPTSSGSADVDCLVSGSPWKVSTNDLESQFPQVMQGINVTGVQIAGEQRLTVDGDLHATFTDNSTTTVTVAMSQGLNMKMVQKHRGSSSGTWSAHEGKLVSEGPWSGGIRGSTKFTINGKATQAPFQAPTGGLADHAVTFACADGTLNLTVEGSPFSYLLTRV